MLANVINFLVEASFRSFFFAILHCYPLSRKNIKLLTWVFMGEALRAVLRPDFGFFGQLCRENS